MPNPPTSEQVAKLAAELTVDAHLKEVAKLEAAKLAAKLEAAKLLAQHDVEMGLLREAGLNVDRAKVADDGSREEVD
jgi:hypothetical protein